MGLPPLNQAMKSKVLIRYHDKFLNCSFSLLFLHKFSFRNQISSHSFKSLLFWCSLLEWSMTISWQICNGIQEYMNALNYKLNQWLLFLNLLYLSHLIYPSNTSVFHEIRIQKSQSWLNSCSLVLNRALIQLNQLLDGGFQRWTFLDLRNEHVDPYTFLSFHSHLIVK